MQMSKRTALIIIGFSIMCIVDYYFTRLLISMDETYKPLSAMLAGFGGVNLAVAALLGFIVPYLSNKAQANPWELRLDQNKIVLRGINFPAEPGNEFSSDRSLIASPAGLVRVLEAAIEHHMGDKKIALRPAIVVTDRPALTKLEFDTLVSVIYEAGGEYLPSDGPVTA